MKYRPEIDGLRAVAVVPVVLFHAGCTALGGGYLGVDIFFVISGYLITSIIVDDLDKGNFSFGKFYERRARRILPALFVMMLACVPFALLWMTPDRLIEFGQSVMATALFVSNIFFWRKVNYFEAQAEEKPLLHTWSLGVEEQFYIIFPILIVVLYKSRRDLRSGPLAILALSGFVLYAYVLRFKPEIAFYLAPARAWELLAGTACARVRAVAGQRDKAWLAATGLGFILLAISGWPGTIGIPALPEILAVVGAATIILFSTSSGVAGAILASRPARFLGLISYSTYLWHQPLMAFARIRILHAEGWPMAAMTLLSFILAYLSWRFIEVPFRTRHRISPRAILHIALAGSLLAVAFGGAVWAGQGFSPRHTPAGPRFADLAIDSKLAENSGLGAECDEQFTLSPHCRTANDPEIMLWGDSFAMHLVPALKASDPDIRLIQHTKSWCAPILGVAGTNASHPPHWSRQCIQFNDRVAVWAGQQHGIRYAVLSSPFGIISGTLVKHDGTVITADQYPLVLLGIRQTVARLLAVGIRPVIISPTPKNDSDIGRCLAYGAVFGEPANFCDFSKNDFSAQTRAAYRLMADVSRIAPVVMLSDFLCQGGTCRTRAGNIFLYRDSGHLSIEGSRYLGRRMALTSLIKARADAFSYPSS